MQENLKEKIKKIMKDNFKNGRQPIKRKEDITKKVDSQKIEANSKRKYLKQSGAELCQSQVQLG